MLNTWKQGGHTGLQPRAALKDGTANCRARKNAECRWSAMNVRMPRSSGCCKGPARVRSTGSWSIPASTHVSCSFCKALSVLMKRPYSIINRVMYRIMSFFLRTVLAIRHLNSQCPWLMYRGPQGAMTQLLPGQKTKLVPQGSTLQYSGYLKICHQGVQNPSKG